MSVFHSHFFLKVYDIFLKAKINIWIYPAFSGMRAIWCFQKNSILSLNDFGSVIFEPL